MKGKLEALAYADGILQNEIDVEEAGFTGVNKELREQGKLLNQHAETINQIGALAADNDSRIRATRQA